MNRYSADEDDEGDHEVVPDEPQSTGPRDDALQSFDPFNDVFSGPVFSYPQEQAFSTHPFNDSRPEDAWTDNARGRSLSNFLQSSDPLEDPLWWNENKLPYFVAAEESNTASMPRDVQATAIRSPLGQSQGGAVVTTVTKTIDDSELSAGDFEKGGPWAGNAEGRSRMPSVVKKEHPAQPKLTGHGHTGTTEEKSNECNSGVYPVSRLASAGRGEDVPSSPPGQTEVVEDVAADMSRAASATQPKSPSSETPFNTAPKRRESRCSDRETGSKRLKRSAASIPSMSNQTRLPLRGQHLSPQASYQLPREHSEYHRQIDGYFPPEPRNRSYPSDFHDLEELRPESVYPDPSLYAIAPNQGPVEQPHAAFQPPQVNNQSRSIQTDLRRQRGQFLDTEDGGSGHHQRPTARRQLQANPGVETNFDKGKFEWPGQEAPDLANLSTWPPPYPDMDQPGPGGPGTWPCDWIELESHRTQMKYPRFPRGTDKIPGRHPLQTYCYWFPNHVRDAGLDLFRAAGWSGRKIWDHYHPNAVEVCRARAEKGDGKLADRPWNFLQQWLSRRKREVEKQAVGASSPQDAASQSDDSSSDDSSRQIRGRPGYLQLSVGPNTPSMSKTKQASGQTSQYHPEVSLGHNAGYFLTSRNIGLAHLLTEGNRPALIGSRHSQRTTSEPWWRGQLMTQIERVRQLLRETNPVFDQQSHRTQILEADLHLRRLFPMFARRVWLQVLQGLVVPQNNLHPINALRNIYGQLRRTDPHMQLPDEQRFCDGMMERYLRDISNFLTNEEHRLHGPPAVSSATSQNVNTGAFQHPRGSLHGFHPAGSTNAQADTLLLQQPISHHKVGQTQHDTNSAAIERSLVQASSAPSAGNSDMLSLTAQSYPFNQPGLPTRASAQPVSRASLENTGAERHRQKTDSEEDVPFEQYLSLFERPDEAS